MPFPTSPFSANLDLGIEKSKWNQLTLWLCKTPTITTFRVNTLLCSVQRAVQDIQMKLFEISDNRSCKPPRVIVHPILTETISVEHFKIDEQILLANNNEVIIDVNCGAAVLRGAHIFAPGVLGLSTGCKIDDEVSVYVDVSKRCKKGAKNTTEIPEKLHIGNGILKMSRYHLFGDNLETSGIAVLMQHTISGCPQLSEDCSESGNVMLQNIPSIVCVSALNPRPGEVILDMCASPGNKTTHIAAKMNNEGILIAIDKTPTKLKNLLSTCEQYKCSVRAFQADSTKIYSSGTGSDVTTGPPFGDETFDRILLDAPCSALGKRPQLRNDDTIKMIRSFVPLQRKLFTNAVNLLKVHGTLVYSTCTITLGENEEIVRWALRTFDCLKLEQVEPALGGAGWNVLGDFDANLVQRFCHEGDVDSVGFFIAKFVKIKKSES